MHTTSPFARTQRGKISLFGLLLTLFVIGVLVLWAEDRSPAEYHDVQTLVTLASTNPAAKAKLAEDLKATPQPNQGELAGMRLDVNAALVAATSAVVTGQPTVQPATQHAKEPAQDPVGPAGAVSLGSLPWGWAIAGLLLFSLVVSFFIRSARRF